MSNACPNLAEAAIQMYLTTHLNATVHTLRRWVMEHLPGCKIEDFNAALVDLIDIGVVRFGGNYMGHTLFEM